MTEYRPETSLQNIYTTFNTPTALQNYTPTYTLTANYTFGDLTYPNKDGNQFEYKITSNAMLSTPSLSPSAKIISDPSLMPNMPTITTGCPEGYTMKQKFIYHVANDSGEIYPAELNNYCISDRSLMRKNPTKQILSRLCGNPDYAILVDNVNFVYKCAYNPSS
jgi:hypothetical protein